ncbi:MAG: HEAT repeat domain-containing protein [Planctomycetes bacterium]|nr:HEAT repeat domain-containing protein [Planctomycetota bacterium]
MSFRAAIPVLALALPALAHLSVSSADGAARALAIRFDLDLALPPGTPLDLSRALPHTPVGPPRTPSTPAATNANGERRTASTPQTIEIAPAVPGGFALLRVLTWDLTAHIGWLGEVDRAEHPFTRGGGELPYPPPVQRPFWWMTLAPLLRLLLHPQLVSEEETRAHLIELGEAVLPALDAARSEPALEPLCEQIAAQIGRPTHGSPAPRRDADPDRAMWLRFVAEQLVQRHPHDPELGFGEQLYLFGERAVPAVVEYLDHEHPFLRRNAVVALERLGGRAALDALVERFGSTKDPVQWCRAALALGRRRYAPALDPLLEALAKEEERWRLAVLMHAIGSIGEPRAAALLAKRAHAFLGHPDLAMAALVALARLPQREAPDEVRRYLEAVLREPATRWRCPETPPGYAPDRPDANDARHRALVQLARIARSASALGDASSAEVLLGWVGTPAPSARELRFTGLESASSSLSQILPPARLVYLEQLARLGEPGRRVLLAVARDGQVDPLLRAEALRFAPSEERALLAAELSEDPRAEDSLRVAALEILSALRPPALAAVAARLARPLLKGRDLDSLAPAERFLLRRAMEALGATGGADGLELLLAWAAARSAEAPVSSKLEQALRAQAAALVSLVAEKRSVKAARQEIADLVDLAISKRLSPIYREANREQALARIAALLEGLRARHEASYRELVAVSIANELTGRAPSGGNAEVVFEPRVPLGDALCSELARRSAPQTQLALLRRLQEKSGLERGYAALALGGVSPRVAGPHLLAALEDREPFVRLCASVALERATGEPNRCDWISGSPAACTAAIESWRAALEQRR